MCKPLEWCITKNTILEENYAKSQNIPEVRAAKHERKDKLREFLLLLEVDDLRGLQSLFKEMVGEVLKNGLKAELDNELGYSK